MYNNILAVKMWALIFDSYGYKFNPDKINIIGLRHPQGDHVIVIDKRFSSDWFDIIHYKKVNTKIEGEEVESGQYTERITKILDMDYSQITVMDSIYTLFDLKQLYTHTNKMCRIIQNSEEV